MVTAKTNNLKYDKTITATVLECVNPLINEYKVSYLQDTLYVYGNAQYDIGSDVYVLIPEGNFSNKKIIIGEAFNSKSSNYSITSPEILNACYGFDNSVEFSLSSLDKNNWGKNEIHFNGLENCTNLYNYSHNANYLLFKIDVKDKTVLPLKQYSDYWCINIYCTFIHNDGTRVPQEIYLTSNDFGREPCSADTFITLTKIINIKNAVLFSIDGIAIYAKFEGVGQEDFAQNDIFMKNLELYFVDDYTEQDFYDLTILSSSGAKVSKGFSTNLVPSLQIGDKNVLTQNNCKVWWYKSNIDYYFEGSIDWKAGPGWEPLNNENYNLLVNGIEIECAMQYKVCVLYNNKYYAQTIILYGNNQNYLPFFTFVNDGGILRPSDEFNYDDKFKLWEHSLHIEPFGGGCDRPGEESVEYKYIVSDEFMYGYELVGEDGITYFSIAENCYNLNTHVATFNLYPYALKYDKFSGRLRLTYEPYGQKR